MAAGMNGRSRRAERGLAKVTVEEEQAHGEGVQEGRCGRSTRLQCIHRERQCDVKEPMKRTGRTGAGHVGRWMSASAPIRSWYQSRVRINVSRSHGKATGSGSDWVTGPRSGMYVLKWRSPSAVVAEQLFVRGLAKDFHPSRAHRLRTEINIIGRLLYKQDSDPATIGTPCSTSRTLDEVGEGRRKLPLYDAVDVGQIATLVV